VNKIAHSAVNYKIKSGLLAGKPKNRRPAIKKSDPPAL